MSPEFKELLTRLTNDGYQCYLNPKAFNKNHCYVVKDDKIGYVQLDSTFSLSTVHVPNKQTGTGFRIATGLGVLQAQHQIESAFCIATHWASSSDVQSVFKFESWEQFKKSDYCERVLFSP